MAYGNINVPGLDKFDLLGAYEKAIPENSDFLLGVEGEELIRVPASEVLLSSEKGANSGVAELDASGKVPIGQTPATDSMISSASTVPTSKLLYDVHLRVAALEQSLTNGTEDLTAGTSPLADGTLYFVYE